MFIKIIVLLNNNVYLSLAALTQRGDILKQSEFKRWLAGQGADFKQGKKHLKVYLNGRQSTLPRHPGHEIGEALRKAILKQLGI
jgi:mRNA interferase HicA